MTCIKYDQIPYITDSVNYSNLTYDKLPFYTNDVYNIKLCIATVDSKSSPLFPNNARYISPGIYGKSLAFKTNVNASSLNMVNTYLVVIPKIDNILDNGCLLNDLTSEWHNYLLLQSITDGSFYKWLNGTNNDYDILKFNIMSILLLGVRELQEIVEINSNVAFDKYINGLVNAIQDLTKLKDKSHDL
jgi:hypothetical protein